MKAISSAVLALAIAGCAAPAPGPQRPFILSLVDLATAVAYRGSATFETNSTGSVHIDVDGLDYAGEYNFSQGGGGYSFGSILHPNGTMSSTSEVATSAMGNGMAYMRAPGGDFIRCVFNFNSMARTGMGMCASKAGRRFDLSIR